MADAIPPNAASQYSAGDITFILFCMALVWLMIPGLGYFYSGMARYKNALSLIMVCLLSLVVVTVQWFMFGFSLTFSKNASKFIGNFDNAFLRGVLGEPSIGSDKIPDLVFCLYQGLFSAITPGIALGAGAERGRLLPMIIFIFIWTTIVYDPVACWTWNPNGWSAKLGILDFAGGTPVHITSGFGSLAYILVLGKRNGQNQDFKPHNMSNVVLGTALLWFGWFGFNGGSALAGNVRAVMACYVTNLSASVGGLTWLLLDYRIQRKFSALGFCSGAVAGLVAITPASGFVSPACSLIFGFLGAIFCNGAIHLKHWLNYDDAVDVFAVHGVGGYIGSILTGFFAEASIAKLDGTTVIAGGWLDHNWSQVGYQFADATAGAVWSFTITYVILFCMNRIPGLAIRVDPKDEVEGLDMAELGEFAYFHVEKIIGIDPETGTQTTITKEVKRVSCEEEKEKLDTVVLQRLKSDGSSGNNRTGDMNAI